LDELNATAKIDITRKYKIKETDAKLKMGTSHNYKRRNYEILTFDMQFFGNQLWENPDPATVLNDVNLYPNKPNSIYYQSGNNNPNPNAYSSNVQNSALYISNEMYLIPRLKTILGVRAENYVLRHTGRDQRYASNDFVNGKNLDNEIVLNSLNFFPSINLIYEILEMQNLRLAYSQTVARPSFKEMSFAQIMDPITNRIFNGSLFTYSNWDGNLVETKITNIDFRWELFLEGGQMYSLSAFYKKFVSPIELVRIPEQQTSTEYQARNVGDGQVIGVEFEFRKNLGFIASELTNLVLSGNLTVVESVIDMTIDEFQTRKNYEKQGETIQKTRQMAGQSPYVINAGISYSNDGKGLSAGLFYNVKGRTLYIVGGGLFPDIYIEPFHGLNFSVNQRIGKERKTEIDFKISNILNAKKESFYSSFKAEDEIFSSINPGITFGIGLKYRF